MPANLLEALFYVYGEACHAALTANQNVIPPFTILVSAPKGSSTVMGRSCFCCDSWASIHQYWDKPPCACYIQTEETTTLNPLCHPKRLPLNCSFGSELT